jgi:4-amino-4-deoxy-L-arabinose transferase-like glycosyltransferase
MTATSATGAFEALPTRSGARLGVRSVRALTLLAVVACVAGAALRLPAIMQPLGIDQGIFSAAAWGMSEGGALYRDLWDQKPPGIHLLYRATFALIGPRENAIFWMDYAAFLATIGLIVAIGRRLVDATWGWGAAAVYALLGLPSVRFGHGGFLERAVPEAFIPVFVLAATACVLSLDSESTSASDSSSDAAADAHTPWDGRIRAALAGACIGCAALFKPTALIYWPMLLIVIPLIAPRLARLRGRLAIWSILGLALPILLCALWLWQLHALEDAWAAVVQYNRAYLKVGYQPLAFIDRFVHEVWRLTKTDPLWLLGMSGLALGIVTRGSRVDRAVLLGGASLIAALIAAAANGARFYSTYFMPCLVPLSLLAATLIFTRWSHRTHRLIIIVLLAIASVRSVQTAVPQRVRDTVTEDIQAWRSGDDAAARLRYLEGFGSYAAGRGFSARANTELSAWLDAHSDAHDRIFIFGMAPGVYFTSKRLPAQRFLWIGPAASNLLPRPDFSLEAVAAGLERTKPRYIIEEHNNRDSLLGWRVEEKFDDPSIRQVLTAYEALLQIEDFSIYRRRDSGAPPPSLP